MNGACNSTIFGPTPWGHWEGQKVKLSLNFNKEVNFKDFMPNFVFVLTNKRFKEYWTGRLLYRLGHAPGVGLGGAWGTQGCKKI